MGFIWAQERLGYHLTIVHRSNNVMVYVDDFTRRFGYLISYHIAIAAFLISCDCTKLLALTPLTNSATSIMSRL